MTLSISILGPLVIESDDWRLGKVPKKARALLAYLAAQGGQAVSRERLADLLWPYQGSEQARHSLRNCLLELRKALGRSAAVHLWPTLPIAGFKTSYLTSIISSGYRGLNSGRTCEPRPTCTVANSSPISTSTPNRSRNGWRRSEIAR